MTNPILKSVSAVFLAITLTVSAAGAPSFQPHEILRMNFRSYTGLVNSISTFATQITPDAAGTVMFLSAAMAMNPAFAAVDLTRPMALLLLTGAGTAKNTGGEYVPDLFLCAVVSLRENATLQNSLSVGGIPFSTFRLSDGRAVLYQQNPLYNKMLHEKAASLFPIRRDLPLFQLQMDLNSVYQLPFIQEAIANAISTATAQNPDIQPDDLTKEFEKSIHQAKTLTVSLNFPNDRTLELQGKLSLKPNSDTAKRFDMKKAAFDFSTIPVLKTATEIFLLDIPNDPKLKSFLIRQIRQTTLPTAFLDACITHATGAILASADSKTGRVKTYIALLPGTARLLLQLMKDDKTIQELSPGLWIIDYQEDGVSTYAKVLDNGLYLVAGRISEVTAKRMMDDRTPLPKSVNLDANFFAVYKKKGSDDTFSRIGTLRYFRDRISGSFLLHPSDFPKPPPAARPAPAK